MAGRRRARRASTSTVATIDEDTIKYFRESELLKPTEDSLGTDDWPIFQLKNATVYNKNGDMANLLHVDREGPFTCRGQLVLDEDKDRDQISYLVRGHTKTRTAWLEISNIVTYSIGFSEHEMPALWTSGDRRWFEITPSEKYTSIATTMYQGIGLYYHVTDCYENALDELRKKESRKPKSKQRKNLRIEDVDLPIEEVLHRYAVDVGDGVTHEEVVQRCKDQSAFILSSKFPKGTGFYSWLSSECSDVARELSKKPNSDATATATTIPEADQMPPEANTRASNPTKLHNAKGKAKSAVTGSSQRSTRSSEQAEVIALDSDGDRNTRLKSMKGKRKASPQVKHEIAEPVDVDMRDFAVEEETFTAKATSAGTSKLPSDESEVGLFAVLSVLNAERAKLLEDLNNGKTKKHPDNSPVGTWQIKVYLACKVKEYASRSEIFEFFAGDLVRHLGSEWKDSELYKWAQQHANSKPNLQYFTEEDLLGLSRRHKASQTAGREVKALAIRESQPIPRPSGKRPRGRTSGKAAGLRPSLGGKKRLRDEDFDHDDMDIDSDLRYNKTAKTSQYLAEGVNDEEIHSAASSDEDEKIKEASKVTSTRVVVLAEKLPSTEPKGPNHTWTCEEPDCGYMVRGANVREGQDMIRQHFEEHEKDDDDEAKERELSQINLAIQEGTRNHLPINNLLDKIRRAGVKQPPTLDGRPIPEPIKHSLLV